LRRVVVQTSAKRRNSCSARHYGQINSSFHTACKNYDEATQPSGYWLRTGRGGETAGPIQQPNPRWIGRVAFSDGPNIATTRIYDHRRTWPEDSPTFKVVY
jgi:hypothetical protein